ncbi:cupin domain-containing protein [Haloarchaeobius amylolyticus]|uniref:Cupin domain-containing protein n=1 Tax=Haloarchaeobius amylolyticus TaxID=1198296 RepID=A0ABD6BBW3_9EURY
MEKASIDDVEPNAFGRDIDCRGLSEPLGTTDFSINYFCLEPGEGFSNTMHTHMDQEEVFVVVEGEATFTTMDDEVVVGEGEAIRFAPGEYQTGTNETDDPVVAYAMGAPRDSEDVRVPRDCPECANGNMRAVPGDDGFTLVCPECGAELNAE